jgi:hypothetical protein
LDAEFKKALTKEDSEITDLAQLFKKKKAKSIITLIKRFEYNHRNSEAEQKKLVKIIKMNMGKEKGDALTEAQITTGLFKLAVSEYTLKSEAEIKA